MVWNMMQSGDTTATEGRSDESTALRKKGWVPARKSHRSPPVQSFIHPALSPPLTHPIFPRRDTATVFRGGPMRRRQRPRSMPLRAYPFEAAPTGPEELARG